MEQDGPEHTNSLISLPVSVYLLERALLLESLPRRNVMGVKLVHVVGTLLLFSRVLLCAAVRQRMLLGDESAPQNDVTDKFETRVQVRYVYKLCPSRTTVPGEEEELLLLVHLSCSMVILMVAWCRENQKPWSTVCSSILTT